MISAEERIKRNKAQRERRARDGNKYRDKAKAWREKNRDKIKEYTKKYYDNHRELALKRCRLNRLNNLTKRRKDDSVYGKTLRGRYNRYRCGAKRRNIEFSLTFEEFSEYWNNRCYYCDEKINGIGLDRLDNDIGYLRDNIVPCCGMCNKMKLTMTKDNFINRCKIIYEKHK